MSEIETGGPAFPESYPGIDPRVPGWIGGGLTIRDYFAAKAMQACIAVCANDSMGGMTPEDYFAQKSYECADAMLVARSKP